MSLLVDARGAQILDPEDALGCQLARTKEHGRLTALVLTDSRGALLASAGDIGVCTALGALAPLAPHARTTCLAELTGGDVTVRALRPHGTPLFLAALGGTAARDAVLASAARGVERILLSN